MTIRFFSEQEADYWNSAKSAESLNGIHRGIEKESLRVDLNGHIAQTSHPRALGSALTHKYITTDYSEALLEFITPASDELDAPINWLKKIHQFTYHNLDNEILWATSMPCVMGEDSGIPIAQYGTSNSGRMKTIYREGLGKRYGRFMQTIAGVHYNFSFSEATWKNLYELSNSEQSKQDFISERYMGAIRNFNRYCWLIPYLFGASPALCESFLKNRPNRLKTLVPGTKFEEYATSLRMSDLGYQNNVQSQLKVCINSLDQYIKDLEYAISTPDPFYQSLGVIENGEYLQLNANILQIENEFYSKIRPKRNGQSGERPTKSLRNHGVEYLEVRTLDINPFSDVGIEQNQLDFLDVFLLSCLIHHSPCITEREMAENKKNFERVVKGGRDPQMYLWRNNKQILLKDCGSQLFDSFALAASLLDKGYQTSRFSNALAQFKDWVIHPDKTLSAQVLKSIKENNKGFYTDAFNRSKNFYEKAVSSNLSSQEQLLFESEANLSFEKQTAMEQDQSKTFAEFLTAYYS